jgi:predicted SprT family Zn-dependent metalloprotease
MGVRPTVSIDFDARVAARADSVAVAEGLVDMVALRLGERVRLVVHDNSSTMLSFRRAAGCLHLRVHHLFLGAPDEVAEAIADFAARPNRRGRRAAGRRIDAWIRSRRGRIAPPRLRALDPRGKVHDLQGMFDRLNAEHFDGAVVARIGWGRSTRSRGQRSIKMGVYLHDARAIRVHPALDRDAVPEFFVEAVVFHEMLHQVVSVEELGGRRVVHGREFRRRERALPGHARAKAWERENLHVLLSTERRSHRTR